MGVRRRQHLRQHTDKYWAVVVHGQRYDTGIPYGLMETQLALAPSGSVEASPFSELLLHPSLGARRITVAAGKVLYDTSTEARYLYFVHRGRVEVEVEGEKRVLGEGGLFHASSTTPRKVSNPFDEEAIILCVGGKDGYVERDGHLVDAADLERRASFGKN